MQSLNPRILRSGIRADGEDGDLAPTGPWCQKIRHAEACPHTSLNRCSHDGPVQTRHASAAMPLNVYTGLFAYDLDARQQLCKSRQPAPINSGGSLAEATEVSCGGI